MVMNLTTLSFALILGSASSAGSAEDARVLMALVAKGSTQAITLSDDELKTISETSYELSNEIKKSHDGRPWVELLRIPSFYMGALGLRSQNSDVGMRLLCSARRALCDLIAAQIASGQPSASSSERTLAYHCRSSLLLQITHDIGAARSAGVREQDAGHYNVVDFDARKFIEPPRQMTLANLLLTNKAAQRDIFLHLWTYFYGEQIFPSIEERKAYFILVGFSNAELDELLKTLPEWLRSQ